LSGPVQAEEHWAYIQNSLHVEGICSRQ